PRRRRVEPVPPCPRGFDDADRHADRGERGHRPHRRPGNGRRRLSGQTLPSARAAVTGARGAAARRSPLGSPLAGTSRMLEFAGWRLDVTRRQLFSPTGALVPLRAAGPKAPRISPLAAQMASGDRRTAFRRSGLSLAKTCSIGFRSREYFGRNRSLAPAARMNARTALPLWLPRLSMTTMSPGRSVGTRTLST